MKWYRYAIMFYVFIAVRFFLEDETFFALNFRISNEAVFHTVKIVNNTCAI